MAGARETSRIARALAQRPLALRSGRNFPLRSASTLAEKTTSNNAEDLGELESTTTFSSPAPDQSTIDSFNSSERVAGRERKLPGSRYQYHPPKYYRGPLHPVQLPPSSDPIARDFVPGPFSMPRIKHTYDSTIAPDLMTLTYQHMPPGTVPPESKKGQLREWDGSSPYHKNRPRRGPRGGGSSRLPLVERDITFANIPEIKSITINSFAPKSCENKEYLHVSRAVVQAISGTFPEATTIKHHIVQWKLKKGAKAGAKATLTGGAAYDFLDKLITLVLPRIKDWPGLNATTGDGSGNIALGMQPDWMAYFPEIEFNYDMYPPKLMPGCDIFIQTTGTSDRQGRLLLEALGFPFYGKVMH